MSRPLLWCPLLALSACTWEPPEVVLSGRVLEARDAEAPGIAGATVTSRNAIAEVVDSTTTDEDGGFSLNVTGDGALYLALEAPDWTPTAISGLAGSADFAAVDGVLWMRSPAQVEALRTEFGPTCDKAQDAGGIVEGEVRLYIPGNDPDTLPLVTTATVLVYDAGGQAWSACYLESNEEEDGGDTGSPDTGATDTGSSDTGTVDTGSEDTGTGDTGGPGQAPTVSGTTGRFAVFGLPEGPLTVEVVYDTGYRTYTTMKLVWLPEGGVAPFYPAYVQLPT